MLPKFKNLNNIKIDKEWEKKLSILERLILTIIYFPFLKKYKKFI